MTILNFFKTIITIYIGFLNNKRTKLKKNTKKIKKAKEKFINFLYMFSLLEVLIYFIFFENSIYLFSFCLFLIIFNTFF